MLLSASSLSPLSLLSLLLLSSLTSPILMSLAIDILAGHYFSIFSSHSAPFLSPRLLSLL